MLSHKTRLGKFKKIEIISSIFSDYKAMRLEINYRKKKTAKNTNRLRLTNMLLNDQWITEEIKEEIKNTWRQMKMKIQQPKIYRMQQKHF